MGVEPTFARNAPVWPLTTLGRLPEEAPDPGFFLPDGLLEKGAREAAETIYLKDRSPVFAKAPIERLGPSVPKLVRHGKWHAAIVASLVFHAAAAWFFIDRARDDVLIEGSENAGITMLGSASEDQASAGEIDATQVTLIDIVEPKPVETVTAETVPVVETAETVPVEPAEPVEDVVAEAPVPDTVVAEREAVTPAVEAQTAPPEPVKETTPQEKPVEAVTETPPPASEPVEVAVPVLPSDAPEILAVDKIAPADDATAVAKPAEAAEPAEVAKAETVEAAEAVKAEPVEAVKETPPEPEKPVAKPEPKPAEKPVKKKAEAKPVEKKKPEKKAEKKPAEKPVEKKAAEAQPKKKPSKAGSGGANQADAKRGAADGEEAGTPAAKGKKGKTASSGNASVSNYPGKVVSKLRRALRYPAEARAKRLKGEVQVAFTVSAGGGVSGVRVVRSSGSPILDKAALDTVRRAAPFPAIPADAGRSSWPFTVPLAFVR